MTTQPPPRALPERAGDTTAEQPWPVRLLSVKIGEYVEKMSPLWVEGQVVQLTRRPGAGTCYLTLRDADVDMSLSVTVPVNTLDAMPIPVREGARVVVHAKPTFWTKRGTLHLDARRIRPVGEGELLARIEHLKQVLRSEGVFDAARKKPLPFLPRRVGLICGRASAAYRDVVDNARRRWPAVTFEVREVPVQGPEAVLAVSGALQELDVIPDVDVIVIARGGGSFEDLLAFSNETLVRAVSAARTPVVSAIGHEVDTPLLDFVADVRASTPTDAGRRIVPDLGEEMHRLSTARERARAALTRRVSDEQRRLDAVTSRPVLADRSGILAPHHRQVADLAARVDRAVRSDVTRASDRIAHLRTSVRLLSPLGTLQRGYAIVQTAEGHIVRDRADVTADEVLRVRLSTSDFGVRVIGRR